MSSMREVTCKALITAVLLCWAAGCGDGAPSQAKLVEPAIAAPCRYYDCSGHGACAVQDGNPICLCDVGYRGNRCQACEPGFHFDAKRRCLADRSCAEQPT